MKAQLASLFSKKLGAFATVGSRPDRYRLGANRVMRWLFPVSLVLLAALLCWFCVGCGPIRNPTPSGLAVYYSPNEKRLSAEKAAELDARHAAVLKCLPPESLCRHEPPTFSLGELGCDTFLDVWDERHFRGRTYLNGTHRIRLPGSLGAAAHEMIHYYTCTTDHPDREAYKATLLATCGDEIDRFFRRMYPPKECEEAWTSNMA